MSALLRTALVALALTAGCGQKGPLVLRSPHGKSAVASVPAGAGTTGAAPAPAAPAPGSAPASVPEPAPDKPKDDPTDTPPRAPQA